MQAGGPFPSSRVSRRAHNCPVIGDALASVIRHPPTRPWGIPAQTDPDRLLKLARRASRGLLAFGALTAGAVVVVTLLAGSRPAWWGELGFTHAERAKVAGAVDNGAWTLVTQVRPMSPGEDKAVSGPWSVSLSAADASAWLNEKLPQWLRAQENPITLPRGAELRAAFEPGTVRLGLRVPSGEAERFIALSITPRIDEQGLWLPATGASVGRLDLPSGLVLSGDDPSPRLSAVLRGSEPALRNATFRLPDGRSVRLLRVQAEQERVVLTMRTEAPAGR